jgi:prepilin-type N-terminal cleavage/methylation domain-containing protein
MKSSETKKLRPDRGVTLVEIMMALVILALAILPVIGTFSKYYGVATRQLDQEIALKIGEAAMNKLMAHKYSDMVKGESFTVPLDFQTPSGTLTGQMNFDGGTGVSGPIKIGKVTYQISARIDKVFVAQNLSSLHTKALMFRFPVDPVGMPPGPPPQVGASLPLAIIATYSSFDDLVAIKLKVDFGGPKDKVELTSFRADMTR